MKRQLISTVASLAALSVAPAWAANVFQTDLASIAQVSGVSGALRAGSIWAPAPAPADVLTLVDGAFLPTGTLWHTGTFWWDEGLNPQGVQKVFIEIQLNAAHTVDRFVVQGDDNEAYHVEWWDGAVWQLAYTAAAVNTFGMETRDSGALAPITSDRFRVYAQGGDAYYSLAEVQAFDVNRVGEPAGWALMPAALLALALRRRRG